MKWIYQSEDKNHYERYILLYRESFGNHEWVMTIEKRSRYWEVYPQEFCYPTMKMVGIDYNRNFRKPELAKKHVEEKLQRFAQAIMGGFENELE